MMLAVNWSAIWAGVLIPVVVVTVVDKPPKAHSVSLCHLVATSMVSDSQPLIAVDLASMVALGVKSTVAVVGVPVPMVGIAGDWIVGN